jgi:hypothetical protein
MAGAFRSLFARSLLRRQASWSYVTWTSFSPVFWPLTSCTARARSILTVFGACWMFVETRLRMPI